MVIFHFVWPCYSYDNAKALPWRIEAKALSATRIDLRWSVPQRGEVAGYRIYRNGAFHREVKTNYLSDRGLDPGTAYRYRVMVFYRQGGQAEIGAEIEVTTPHDLEDMVLVPAGEFLMGAGCGGYRTIADPAVRKAEEEACRPLRKTYVSSFYIGKYEVTYEKWMEIYRWAVNHGYDFGYPPFKVSPVGQAGSQGKGKHMPVVMIQWYDAVKWLNARSEMEGLKPCYYTDSKRQVVYRQGQVDVPFEAVDFSASGYRLPTEAEWEKACRGGLEGKRYPWGGDRLDPEKGNFAESKTGGTVPVGSYPPSGYGLYDMAGNVWELTNDRWAPGLDLRETKDPKGPKEGGERVRRGGGWSHAGFPYGRCDYRGREKAARPPAYGQRPYYGFRIVKK